MSDTRLVRYRNVSWMHGENGDQCGVSREWYRADLVDELLAAAPVPCAASPADLELLGLSIDMLDADRLRIWAEKIETHGADISHWSSPVFVVKELRRMADGICAAVKDIGTLRATGEGARDDQDSREAAERIVDRRKNASDQDAERRMDSAQAPPVAVSLDPHRLLVEEIERAAWCGNSVYHDDWDQGRYDDRCGACRRSLNAIELLLARLRGEATVRVEE